MPPKRNSNPGPSPGPSRRREPMSSRMDRLENKIDDLLQLLEIAQGAVSSLRRQIADLVQEMKDLRDE